MRANHPPLLRAAPWLIAVLVVVTAALAASAPRAAADPADPPHRPQVTLLGDSVFAGLANGSTLDGLRTTYDVTLDAKVCRRSVAPSCTVGGQTPNTGVEAMRARTGSLGDVLVVGLGYNDDGRHFDIAIDAVMTEAAEQHVPQVMWLTMRTDRYASSNAALEVARARHPTLLVVDWNAASAGHDDWFTDGLHLRAGGRGGLATFIGEQLDRLASARCRDGAPVVGQERPAASAVPDQADAIAVDGRVQLASPTRVLDTRIGTTAHPLGAGRVIEVPIVNSIIATGRTVPGDAVAAIMNVTAVDACADGFLTVFPCRSAIPTASNLNVTAAGTVANLVTVALSDGRACIYSMVTTDVVVDLAGWYAPTGSTIAPIAPRRIIDTRIGTGRASGAIAARTTISIDVPGALGSASITGVAINLTTSGSHGDGFITAYACGQDPPTASNLNYTAGQIRSNMAIVALASDGRLCIYSHAGTDLIIDVFSVIDSAEAVEPAVSISTPRRIVDSRIGLGASMPLGGSGRLPAGHELVIPIDTTIAGNGLAVLNVTAVHPSGDGWIAAYPCGTTASDVSNLNFSAGSITPGHIVVGVGSAGSVCLVSMVSTDVVVDLIGSSRSSSPA